MITIYQNRCKEFTSELQKEAKYAMMLGAKQWETDFAQYYTPVYEVNTNDLEEAFELTNLWNDMNKINLCADPGPSSSVGDIFVDWIGQCFIVDNMGFTQIPNPFEV
jgi:hypothetical protein